MMEEEKIALTVAVVGASGFVGRELIAELSLEKKLKVRALSRHDYSSQSSERLEWVQCDIFSLKDIQQALQDCDVAIYLVHSMLPSARLTQGNFQDFDLILADNFARAAKLNGLRQIIYLGGIVPSDLDVSPHLRSRLEVERCLRASGVALTALRAGVILGPMGSSFTIMLNLVRKLPIMLCPRWASTLSNPVAIWDVIRSISYCIANTQTYHKHFDIGGPDTLSYQDMLRALALVQGKKRWICSVPFLTPRLSKSWVTFFSGAPKELVYPLLEGLKTHVVPDPSFALNQRGVKALSFEEAIAQSLKGGHGRAKPNAFKKFKNKNHERFVR